MLAKISIIAGIEKSVSSCVQWDRRLYSHHWLVTKLPITIKHFRSAERVHNLEKYVRCGVLKSIVRCGVLKSIVRCGVLKSIAFHHFLLSAIDEILQDRNHGIAWTRRLTVREMMWSVYERLSEPPTVTEEGRKHENLAYKSNDDHIIELDEQSQEELSISEFLPEQNHTEIFILVPMPTILLTCGRDRELWPHSGLVRHRKFAIHRLPVSFLWRNRRKINMTPVIRSSITCHS